jgi:hypothetical protein
MCAFCHNPAFIPLRLTQSVSADPDLGPKLFDAGPGLLKDMLVLVATELTIPVHLRIASLQVYYAYAHGGVK